MISTIVHIARIILIFAATSIGLKAQTFNPRYNFKSLSVQNGLTQNLVYHFLQDSRGYIWIGTHSGLSLYDGVKTINFLRNEQDNTSISGNFITCLLEDSARRIWIGNENGIDVYDHATNKFSHFGIDRPDGTKENSYCVPLGFVSGYDLWFLDTKTKSVRSLNTKTAKTSFVSELNAYHALFYKSSATQTVHIWSSYDKGTIHQVFRNNSLIGQQRFFSGKNEPLSSPVMEVNHVLQQNDTTVWLSTNEGLVKLNPVNNKYTILAKWKKQIVRELRFAALSPTGQLWAGSGPDGVYVFDPASNQFIDNFRNDKLDPFSVCSNNIVSLYFDRTGNIWCGSFGNGASYTTIKNNFFASHLSKSETQAWKVNNSISWLGSDPRGNLWCMFADGPGFTLLDKDLKIKTYKKPLLENGTYFDGSINKLLLVDGGEVWCATNKGLYLYDVRSNRMHFVKYQLINEEVQGSIWIWDIIRLHDGSIIFSTFGGLYRITKESGRPVVKPLSFLAAGDFIGFGLLYEDSANNIYVKSLGSFLFVLKPKGWGKGYDLIKRIDLPPELNHYYSQKGDSLIYLATTDGLYHINNNNFKIVKEGINNDLPFINICSVFKEDYKLWIFGEKGLYFYDIKTRTGRRYTVEDGLPTNEFSFSTFVYTSDRRCIAGSSNGLVSFFPGQMQDSIYAPRPQLTNIYVNDILHSPSQNPNETKKISLSHKENTFSFDFGPIAYHHTAECSFEYKLEGYDEDWIKSGPAHYTRYSKIPPGNYVLNLRVIDAMGRISPFTKTMEIEIAKAYWQTNLFRIASLLFILSIGWLIAKWYFSIKIRRQKQKFEKLELIEVERTRIASDMHDDLGAGLSRIKFLSQSILNKKVQDESIKSELKKITSFSDEMSEKMGEIVWALNKKNDTLADLVAYTRSYAVEYLANHDILCEANTPLQLPVTFITGEMRRNIFLSVKECLHNIVKHSGATKVCFSVELADMMKIIIHDNGKGIDWNKRRAFSNGIENITTRMKEMNGKVKFVNDNGTKVLLNIPLIL